MPISQRGSSAPTRASYGPSLSHLATTLCAQEAKDGAPPQQWTQAAPHLKTYDSHRRVTRAGRVSTMITPGACPMWQCKLHHKSTKSHKSANVYSSNIRTFTSHSSARLQSGASLLIPHVDSHLTHLHSRGVTLSPTVSPTALHMAGPTIKIHFDPFLFTLVRWLRKTYRSHGLGRSSPQHLDGIRCTCRF